MKNPHKQFPGRMDQAKKSTFKKGYRTLKGGNVKEGYTKLTHVKLFENFDEVPAEKWFVAQGSGEKFKFPAKDMDEAKAYAHKAWNAEVLGEATDEMEFEDTPMDEDGQSNSVRKIEQKYIDLFIDVSKDSSDLSYPIPQAKKIIETFAKAHNASGNNDWYTTEKSYTKNEKEADLIGFFLNQLDNYMEDMDEGNLKPTVFLTQDIQKSVKLIDDEIGIDPGYMFFGEADDVNKFDTLWKSKKYEEALNLLASDDYDLWIKNYNDLVSFIEEQD